MDKYENEGVAGEGSYGVVLKCRQKDTGRLVAIKKFLETDEDPTVKKIAMREIRMLKRLRHENLISLIEVFRRRRKLFLVFEYVERTVLEELEEHPRGLDSEVARGHAFQVLRGIEFCHQNNIIHRDIKPENVMVANSGIVKLCDFGFARLMAAPGEAYTDYVATRWYRAPELLVGDPQYGKEVDIWAVGCLFSEMRTGDPVFPGESDIDQLYLITKLLGPLCLRHRQLMMKNPMFNGLNIQQSPSGQSSLKSQFTEWEGTSLDFLGQCLILDPSQRPSATALINGKFFSWDGFNTKFASQIKAKVQEYENNKNVGMSSMNNNNTHTKFIKPEQEAARLKAKQERSFRRRSEAFDELLGCGTGGGAENIGQFPGLGQQQNPLKPTIQHQPLTPRNHTTVFPPPRSPLSKPAVYHVATSYNNNSSNNNKNSDILDDVFAGGGSDSGNSRIHSGVSEELAAGNGQQPPPIRLEPLKRSPASSTSISSVEDATTISTTAAAAAATQPSVNKTTNKSQAQLGNLKRYGGFEHDLNKVCGGVAGWSSKQQQQQQQSRRQRQQHSPLAPPTKKSNNAKGTNRFFTTTLDTSSSQLLHHGRQQHQIKLEELPNPKNNFERIFDKSFHIEENTRGHSSKPPLQLTQLQRQQHQQQTITPQLAQLKKRRQMQQQQQHHGNSDQLVSLPSVTAPTMGKHQFESKTLPRRTRLTLRPSESSGHEVNDENSIADLTLTSPLARPTSNQHNLPEV